MKRNTYVKVQPSKGKTHIFNLYSSHTDEFLGVIHWRPGWRCYVVSYEDGIDMSSSCMKEVCSFIDDLEEKRKENLKK